MQSVQISRFPEDLSSNASADDTGIQLPAVVQARGKKRKTAATPRAKTTKRPRKTTAINDTDATGDILADIAEQDKAKPNRQAQKAKSSEETVENEVQDEEGEHNAIIETKPKKTRKKKDDTKVVSISP